MMSVERERRTWKRGLDGSSEDIISFGKLVVASKSFTNNFRS